MTPEVAAQCRGSVAGVGERRAEGPVVPRRDGAILRDLVGVGASRTVVAPSPPAVP